MLSKTSLQIVKALTLLARLPEGRSEGAVSIARRIQAPQNYLGKVLQHLASEGLGSWQKGFVGAGSKIEFLRGLFVEDIPLGETLAAT